MGRYGQHHALVGGYDLLGEFADYDLFDPGAGGFETDTGAVIAAGTNTIEVSTDKAHSGTKCLKVTYVDNVVGAYIYFRDAFDLSQNLVIGKKYRVTWWGAMDAGDSWNWNLHDGVSSVWTSVETSETLVKYEQEFIAQSATEAHLKMGNMSAGEIAFLDDITIQELYTPDYSGRVNHGTVQDATATPWGYLFAAGAEKITLGTGVANYTDNFTILARIRPTANNSRIVSKRDTGIGTQYDFYVESGNDRLAFYTGGSYGASRNLIADGVWHDVGLIINGSKSWFFSDGRQDGAIFSPTITEEATIATTIGNHPSDNGDFIGDIGWVGLYNQALTQREIQKEFLLLRYSGGLMNL